MKELEQQLQSLEAQKLALQQQQRGDTAAPAVERDVAPTPTRDPAPAAEDPAAREAASAAATERPPFARFFRYPQYAWRHAPPRADGASTAAAGFGAAEDASRASAVADVEVGMVVDAHASLRVMAPRRPGQLLKMVAGMQALGLAVLHLNATAALGGELALYTLSLKVRRRLTRPILSIPESQRCSFTISVHEPAVRKKKHLWVWGAAGCVVPEKSEMLHQHVLTLWSLNSNTSARSNGQMLKCFTVSFTD